MIGVFMHDNFSCEINCFGIKILKKRRSCRRHRNDKATDIKIDSKKINGLVIDKNT